LCDYYITSVRFLQHVRYVLLSSFLIRQVAMEWLDNVYLFRFDPFPFTAVCMNQTMIPVRFPLLLFRTARKRGEMFRL